MQLKENIERLSTIDQYYSNLLVSVDELSTAFYTFMANYTNIAKIMTDPSEFFKHEYPQEYVFSKADLESAIMQYQRLLTDPLYGVIRTTMLNVEFGYSAYRLVQAEKRIMIIIESFNTVYTNKSMVEESYAYAGLAFLESLFNSLSIIIAKTVEAYPIPKNEEPAETDTEVTDEEEKTPVATVESTEAEEKK